MNQVKECKAKQKEELKTVVESRFEEIKNSPDVLRLQKELEVFYDRPDTEGRLYLDESGFLNSLMEVDIGDLASEEWEVIEEILEFLTDGIGYFEQSQYSTGKREWTVHECLGEATIFNESPERNCYAIYSRGLNLEVESVIDEEHGFLIIEQAMRRAGVFDYIVSTDYYGTPTITVSPFGRLTDKEVNDLLDKKESDNEES